MTSPVIAVYDTAPAQVLRPTLSLRLVDKSTCPQLSTENVLQQMFVDLLSGQEVWVDVPHVGHISKL